MIFKANLACIHKLRIICGAWDLNGFPWPGYSVLQAKKRSVKGAAAFKTEVLLVNYLPVAMGIFLPETTVWFQAGWRHILKERKGRKKKRIVCKFIFPLLGSHLVCNLDGS